jgi:hypothetical protein
MYLPYAFIAPIVASKSMTIDQKVAAISKRFDAEVKVLNNKIKHLQLLLK